jgi:hypothetical protein
MKNIGFASIKKKKKEEKRRIEISAESFCNFSSGWSRFKFFTLIIVKSGFEMERQAEEFIEILHFLKEGKIDLSLNGRQFASVDCDSKSIGVEFVGLEESGFHLSQILSDHAEGKNKLGKRSRPSRMRVSKPRLSFFAQLSLLFNFERLAKDLAIHGWNFSVYDGGQRILSLGRGVSRFTGYIHMNPLELKRILRLLLVLLL